LDHFVTDIRKSRWFGELQNIRQGGNESVEDYTGRFRKIFRRATHGENYPNNTQVNFYVQGLKQILRAQTMLGLPANLNAAIERAKLVETSFQYTTLDPATIIPIEQIVVRQQDTFGNPVRNSNNDPRRFRESTPVQTGDASVDEITNMLRQFKAETVGEVKSIVGELRNNQGSNRQMGNGGRRPLACFNCGRSGHFANNCRMPRNNGGNNGGNYGRNYNGNDRRVNIVEQEVNQEEDYDDNLICYVESEFCGYQEHNCNFNNEGYCTYCEYDEGISENYQIYEAERTKGDNRYNPIEGNKARNEPNEWERLRRLNKGQQRKGIVFQNPIGPEDDMANTRNRRRAGPHPGGKRADQSVPPWPKDNNRRPLNQTNNNMEVDGQRKVRAKNQFETTEEYSIVEDLKNMKANISCAQVLAISSKQQKELKQALGHKMVDAE
jgi:hypothetical protein